MYLVDRSGVWYAVGKIQGVLYRESTGFRGPSGSKGYRLAQRRMVEIEHAIRSGAAGWKTAPVPTLREYWAETYEPTYTATKRAPRLDRQMMAHALPILGDLRLDEIATSDCVAYLNARRKAFHANLNHKTPKRISEGTVERERGFLQGVFQRAVDDQIIDRNPWKTIERKGYEVRDRVVTDAELELYLPRLNAEYRRFVRCMLGTGLRLDEMRGVDLKADLDLKKRLIVVRERTNAEGELITRVKLGKTRTVPIPVDVVEDFKEQLAETGRLWSQCQAQIRAMLAEACEARAAKPGRVTTRGKHPGTVIHEQPARVAIPHITPHTLRHTFGWRYLKGGGDIYALAQILGDTVAVVEKHYAQLLKEDLRAKVDQVNLGLARQKAATVLPWNRRGAR